MRKNAGVLFIGLLIFCLMSSLVFADLNAFAGHWVNVDSFTRGITKIDVTINGTQIEVQAWGKASPGDIDWGVVPAYAYASSVSENLFTAAQVVSATYQTNFSETLLLVRPQGTDQLNVETLTRFTDGSRRANYHAYYHFKRSRPEVGVSLETPRQIGPAHGKVFNNFPRTTTLRWSPVNGAVSYTVEVDYYDSSWITDQGKSYLIVPDLTTTGYTFNFVGAQRGRWRVWAVGDGGEESPKSSWWEFRYTK